MFQKPTAPSGAGVTNAPRQGNGSVSACSISSSVADGNAAKGAEVVAVKHAAGAWQNPLSSVLLKLEISHEKPQALAQFISRHKTDGLNRLWGAISELAGDPISAPRAFRVAKAIVNICQENSELKSYKPSQQPFVNFLSNLRSSQPEVLALLKQSGAVDAVEFLADRRVAALCRVRTLDEFIRREAPLLAQNGTEPGRFTDVVDALVRRAKYRSIEMCRFIQRHCDDETVGDKQKSREFFWKLRNQLTQLLMSSPRIAESNLKLSELFSSEVPHPRLGAEPSMVVAVQQERLSKIGVTVDEDGKLHFTRDARWGGEALDRRWRNSAAYIRPTQLNKLNLPLCFAKEDNTPDFYERIIAPAEKRCTLDSEAQGSARAEQQRYPRIWIDEADAIRYQAARLEEVVEGLSDYVAQRRLSPTNQMLLKSFFGRVIREQPHAVSEIRLQMRASHPFLAGLFLRALSEEVTKLIELEKSNTASSGELRATLYVGYTYGIPIRGLAAPALRELEAVLKTATASDLEKYDTIALVGVVRRLSMTSASLEARSIELIRNHPDTLGSAVLALLLYELRCADRSLQALAVQQAQRRDLSADVWLNYSLAANGFGFTEQGLLEARRLFKELYLPSLKFTPQESQRTRGWKRLASGALFPEELGIVKDRDDPWIAQSNSEGRVFRTLEADQELRLKTNVSIQRAPTIEGIMYPPGSGKGCVVFMDSRWFTSVDGAWENRGYKGHTLTVTKMLTAAGWNVLRIPDTFSLQEGHPSLLKALNQIKSYFKSQGMLDDGPLKIDAGDDFKDIASHVMLYTAKKQTA